MKHLFIISFLLLFYTTSFNQTYVDLEPVTIVCELDPAIDTANFVPFKIVKIGKVIGTDPDHNPEFQIQNFWSVYQEPFEVFMISSDGSVFAFWYHIRKYVYSGEILHFKLKVCCKDPQYTACAPVDIIFKKKPFINPIN